MPLAQVSPHLRDSAKKSVLKSLRFDYAVIHFYWRHVFCDATAHRSVNKKEKSTAGLWASGSAV